MKNEFRVLLIILALSLMGIEIQLSLLEKQIDIVMMKAEGLDFRLRNIN